MCLSSNILVDLHHSLHGLVRGDNMELGRDSDTGGQVQTCKLLSLEEN